MSVSNKEIAQAFKLAGALMELHGENAFRTRAYTNAYNALRKFEQPLSELSPDEIGAIPGLGKSSVQKVLEMLSTGQMEKLEKYRSKTPEGIIELLSIRGLGPGKVRTIWKDLQIESPGELLYACNENRLIEAKGFGLKTQEDVRQKLQYHMESRDKWLYARIAPVAEDIKTAISSLGDEVRVEPVGELARFCPVIHKIEFLVAGCTEEEITSLDKITSSEGRFLFDGSIDFVIHFSSSTSWIRDKFSLSGVQEFVDRFDLSGGYSNEQDIFQSNDLPYVIPEMREDADILDAVTGDEEYIKTSDIKGIIHNHSTYSDGLHSLRDMSEYVRDSGYQYFGISDHSKTAVYANGLSVDRVLQQFDEVEKLNEDLAPFRVFKGIESDILSDGSLDYEDDILAQFDFVVASVHSGLKMDEAKATNRLVAAIANPFTDILGHPTGRLLLSRKGYPINHKEVIDACAEYGVAIELNANPLRLDVDYRWIPYAIEKGVLVSVNPDAHSKQGIHVVDFGIMAARKGGLKAKQCLNAFGSDAFETWLKTRRGSLV